MTRSAVVEPGFFLRSLSHAKQKNPDSFVMLLVVHELLEVLCQSYDLRRGRIFWKFLYWKTELFLCSDALYLREVLALKLCLSEVQEIESDLEGCLSHVSLLVCCAVMCQFFVCQENWQTPRRQPIPCFAYGGRS